MSKKRQMIEAINDFVVGCKSDNIWDSIKACCILSGWNNLEGCLTPIKGDAPTNYNFVANDYNRITGLAGDGSTKYLDTNRNGNDDPQNDFHMAMFLGAAINVANITMGAGAASVGASQIQGGQYRNRNGSGDDMDSTINVGTVVGFAGMSRSSSAEFIGRDNATTNTYTRVSQSPFTGNLLTHAREPGGSPGLYSTLRISFYSIGEPLDLENLDNRVSTLITTIGDIL